MVVSYRRCSSRLYFYADRICRCNVRAGYVLYRALVILAAEQDTSTFAAILESTLYQLWGCYFIVVVCCEKVLMVVG